MLDTFYVNMCINTFAYQEYAKTYFHFYAFHKEEGLKQLYHMRLDFRKEYYFISTKS